MKPQRRALDCLLVSALVAWALPAFAVEAVSILESDGLSAPAGANLPCSILSSLNGTCGNLRYYNICTGYIWIYNHWVAGAGVGVRFDGPCIAPGHSLKRAITYYRNIAPGYAPVDVHVDVDRNNDGCPDYTIVSELSLDPALRWNCTALADICVPADALAIIVRQVHRGGIVPTFVTDGPTSPCDPLGTPHSYYYDGQCWGLFGPPGGREENFLTWLVVDQGCATSTASSTWGSLKGLFH